MLSPVAVSWMIGKSIMENRFGPLATLFAGFSDGRIRRSFPRPGSRSTSIIVMDSLGLDSVSS